MVLASFIVSFARLGVGLVVLAYSVVPAGLPIAVLVHLRTSS